VPGYLILHGEVTDPEGYEEYQEVAEIRKRCSRSAVAIVEGLTAPAP